SAAVPIPTLVWSLAMWHNHKRYLTILACLPALVLGFAFGAKDKSHADEGGPPPLHKVVWPAKNPVWTFYWVAPPDSSSPHGAGSGLELRHVFYKGKRVFWQAGVPVINVLYDKATTYGDWLTEYAGFQVNNILGPHYAEPTTPPVTTCANPGAADPGTFKGIALEKHADRLIFTTELEAGWYRYIQKWT